MNIEQVRSGQRACRRCIYYSPTTQYCMRLMNVVEDPNDPPCAETVESKNDLREEPVLQKPENENTVTIPLMGNNDDKLAKLEVPSSPVSKLEKNPSVSSVEEKKDWPATVEGFPSYDSFPVVTVEDVSRDYTSTGIKALDQILGGGFLKGKTYLVAGKTGVGKTIFSLQYLVYGALNNDPGVYVAIDEPTEQLIKGVKKFGWDVTPLIEEDMLRFLDMRAHFSKIYLKDERRKIEPKYIVESILENAREIRAKRLVIDPIAPLIYGGTQDDVLYAREFLREMVFAIERIGNLTTVLTSEIPTGSNQLSRFGVEEFLACGIIVLSIDETDNGIERVLFIRKARWAPVKPSKYVFEILPGTGLVLTRPLKRTKQN